MKSSKIYSSPISNRHVNERTDILKNELSQPLSAILLIVQYYHSSIRNLIYALTAKATFARVPLSIYNADFMTCYISIVKFCFCHRFEHFRLLMRTLRSMLIFRMNIDDYGIG
jgi:hypothetical protein